MTQVWSQHGALLCTALQADPECLIPDLVALVSPDKIKGPTFADVALRSVFFSFFFFTLQL